MTLLTITSTPEMGPLEVSVHSLAGDDIDFVLSSGKTTEAVEVEPGTKTVIATRPDGSKLRRTLEVAGEGVAVALMDLVAPSPNEFMWRETARGLVAKTEHPDREGATNWARPLGGALNRSLANAANSISTALSARTVEDGSFGLVSRPSLLRPPLRFGSESGPGNSDFLAFGGAARFSRAAPRATRGLVVF